jgi:hypothetical protein
VGIRLALRPRTEVQGLRHAEREASRSSSRGLMED